MSDNTFCSGIVPKEIWEKQMVDFDPRLSNTCGICHKSYISLYYHDMIWNAYLKRYICKEHSDKEIRRVIDEDHGIYY